MPEDAVKPTVTDRPTHIVDKLGADRTHCGIPLKQPAALPYVGRRFVDAHIAGHPPITFCPECKQDENAIPWLRETVDGGWSISDRD
jgi:hypothetical protein